MVLWNRVRTDSLRRDSRNDSRAAPQEGGEVQADAQKDAGEVAMAKGDRVFAGENLEAARRRFKCDLPGYLELCDLATATVEPFIAGMAKGTNRHLKFQTAFAAGFISGSVAAQGKEEQVRKWLEKTFPTKQT